MDCREDEARHRLTQSPPRSLASPRNAQSMLTQQSRARPVRRRDNTGLGRVSVTPQADIQGTARRPPGLSTVHEEDHEEESTRRHRRRRRSKYLSWDQILVIVCLVATLALGYQRQAWDVVALLGVLLFITLLAPFVRSLRRRRRKVCARMLSRRYVVCSL